MKAAEILLVESDPEVLEHLESLLSAQGFSVRTADTLAQAKNLADESPSDLLLTNLLLRDGNAIDFTVDWTGRGRTAIALTDAYRGASVKQLLIRHARILQVLQQPASDEQIIACLKDVFRHAYPTRIEDTPPPEPSETTLPELFRPPTLDLTKVGQQGDFEEFDVITVFARLALDRVDGALMLQDGQVKKLVYLHHGTPVGVKSNLIQECLGQMLVREGKIHDEDCQNSLELMRQSNRRQGEILVSMGCLPAEELGDALKRQFLRKVRQIIGWNQGVFRYKDSSTPAAYQAAPLDDPVNLIWRAVSEIRPLRRVHAVLDPLENAQVHWSGEGLDLAKLTIGEELLGVWSRIDGTRTLSELLGSAPNPEDALLLVHTLTALGSLVYRILGAKAKTHD